LDVAARALPRDRGQRHGADRDPEEADRELHEAEGDVQPRDGPVPEVGGEVAVDEDVHLHRGRADRRGAHEPEHLAEPGVTRVEDGAVAEARPSKGRELDAELAEPADERPDGHPGDRPLGEEGRRAVGAAVEREAEVVGREPGGAGEPAHDGAHVEEGAGRRRDGEDVARVQDAHRDRGEGHEEEEGEHDRGEAHGERELPGDLGEAGRDRADEGGGAEDAEEDDAAHDDRERVHDEAREAPRGGFAVALERVGERRHEGGGERTLREEVAEEVRDAEGGDERVELAPGAEEERERLLADEPDDAARQHGDAHDARLPGEVGPGGRLPRRRGKGRGGRRALLRLHRGARVDTRTRPAAQAPRQLPPPAASARPRAATGSTMRNVAPAPGALSTSIRPPCAATTLWLIARPSPVPAPTSFVVKKGSKMRARTSGVIPGPSSRMVTVTTFPSARVVIQTFPVPGMASHAFASTFMNTWFSWPGSPSTGGGVP